MATQKFVGPFQKRKTYWHQGQITLPYQKDPDDINLDDIVYHLKLGSPEYGVYSFDPPETSNIHNPFSACGGSMSGGTPDPWEYPPYDEPSSLWYQVTGTPNRFDWQTVSDITFGQPQPVMGGGGWYYKILSVYNLYNCYFYIYEFQGVGSLLPASITLLLAQFLVMGFSGLRPPQRKG